MRRVWIVTLSALSTLWLSGLVMQAQQAPPSEALLGFDPILLVSGKEQLGKDDLATVVDGLKYLFVSAENKRLFDSDPSRYGIQLGGSCARMGGRVYASPDLFLVYEGRIYGFGSPDCVKAFQAEPRAFLPVPETFVEPTGAERERAAVLIQKAARRAGGASLLSSVRGWEEAWTESRGRGGSASVVGRTTLPATYRETAAAEMGGRSMTMAVMVDGARGERTFNGRGQAMHAGGREDFLEEVRRHPIAVLVAALAKDARIAPAGAATLDGRAVEYVRVANGSTVVDLAIEGDGSIAGVRFHGRGETGTFGTIERAMRAHQSVSGLVWPTARVQYFNGVESPAGARTITNVSVTFAER